MTKKTLVDPNKTQDSLINLRNELAATPTESTNLVTIIWKINSCLYSEYPIHTTLKPDENHPQKGNK